jgi:hypothetical protein
MRHLHDKVKTIETRTAPPPEEPSPTSEAANALLYGGMMMTDTLMIANGPAYGGGGAGYGVPGGIPDPYAQQQGYGMPGYAQPGAYQQQPGMYQQQPGYY